MKYYVYFDPVSNMAQSIISSEVPYDEIPDNMVEVSYEVSKADIRNIVRDTNNFARVTTEPAPSPAHAWGPNGWYLSETKLLEYKTDRKKSVDALLNEAMNSKIVVDGITINPDLDALTFNKTVLNSNLSVPLVWKDFYNNFNTFESRDQFSDWISKAIEQISLRNIFYRSTSWQYKQEIDAAKDINELNNISIVFN